MGSGAAAATALGASYEFPPLLTGQALVLANWSDHPENDSVRSEFGSVPATLACTFRVYY